MSCRSCGSTTPGNGSVCSSCGSSLGASTPFAGSKKKAWTAFDTPRRRFAVPLVIFAAGVLAIVIFGLIRTGNYGAAGSPNARYGQASKGSQTDSLGFAAEQNDAIGYNGNQWDTSIEAFIKTVPVSSDARADDQTPALATPVCPDGSVPEQSHMRQYIGYSCKLPSTSNDVEMCSEWEGSYWNPTVTVPCGSRVSAAYTYTGPLTCSISRQVNLLDPATGQLSKEVTCLPVGWTDAVLNGTKCPPGSVNGGPALFGEDHCYGPPPPPPLPVATAEPIHTGSEDDQDDNHELAQVLGVPNSAHGGGLLTYQDTDFSVIPPNFQTVSKDDAEYVFYKGRLAMVYSKLNVYHRVEIVADLMNKFSEVGKSSSGWTRHTLDDGPPDTTDLNVTLFKRGNTSTRIYLIDRVDNETGLGMQVSSLHVLYVPTSSMWEVQHDIQGLADQHQAVSQAATQHAAQVDINKLQ
jgi:hypothetical protein